MTTTVFDFEAFFGALDSARRERELGWYDLAEEMWEQSVELNERLMDHPLCGGAVSRLGTGAKPPANMRFSCSAGWAGRRRSS